LLLPGVMNAPSAADPEPAATSEERPTSSERIERALSADPALSAAQRRDFIRQFRAQLAGHGLDVLADEEAAPIMDALLFIINEAIFSEVSTYRAVGVATAAYLAIRRGAPAESVRHIALYGFRWPLDAERLAVLARGYADYVKLDIPPWIAQGLIYETVKNNWPTGSYKTFKWGLLEAAREGHDPKKFLDHLIATHQKTKRRPRAVVNRSLRVFRRAARKGETVESPEYDNPCSRVESVPLTELLASGLPRKCLAPAAQDAPQPEQVQRLRARYQKRIARVARSFLGTPYVWGGTTREGIDCSGFVKQVFAAAGIVLPRTVALQWTVGSEIARAGLRKGDLVFFKTLAGRISHVGIITDPEKGRFIHSASSQGVTVSRLGSSYFAQRYVGSRRVAPYFGSRLMAAR